MLGSLFVSLRLQKYSFRIVLDNTFIEVLKGLQRYPLLERVGQKGPSCFGLNMNHPKYFLPTSPKCLAEIPSIEMDPDCHVLFI
jgi:hypothetical protein